MADGSFDWSSFSTPNSVSQQYDVSYNGGLGKTTYFGGSQPSAGLGTGLSDAFKGVSNALGSTGLTSLNSVKTALGSALNGSLGGLSGLLGGANISSQLKDTLGVASPTFLDNIPSGDTVTAPPANLQYPNDLGKYFIMFSFYDRFQNNAIARIVPKGTSTIILPIPANLQESFSMQYSEKTLGAFGVLEEAGVLDAIGKAGSGAKAEEMGKDIGKKLGDLVTKEGSSTVAALGRYALQGISGEAGTAFDRATGTILNPYAELQFEGVSLREHSFSYSFSPNSKSEADKLKAIIREFKIRMHPAKNGLLFEFPEACKIEIYGAMDSAYLYSIRECYLKTMSVNYAPSGTPSFFKGGDCPTEVQINLTFGERKPLTRNDFLNSAAVTAAERAASGQLTTELNSALNKK